MFKHFVGLIQAVAKLDAIYKAANQSVDIIIHPGEDFVNFWLAFNADRDGPDYEAEILENKDNDMAFVYECSLNQEELEVTLHNAFVDVEEFIAQLQEKNNGSS